MGIKLLADNAPMAMKEQKFEIYFGQKIVINASMSIYQFLIVVGRNDMKTITIEAGVMFKRTIRLLEAGIKPVHVFDGQPPEFEETRICQKLLKERRCYQGSECSIRVKCLSTIWNASEADIGGQTSLKLIHQHGHKENILENINKDSCKNYHTQGICCDKAYASGFFF
ncbi:hypothetical protein OPV22_029686 [Ensete ventricosum]|uniref:XPG N-terminal domain-containing protein n=1 Tax=Ensete ventricosum TaxID=4639 RepID=A0AAV8Q7M8_ENSVE|nr:hypothetical protein OPV22_029686 [Ensete ventricosum]